MSFFTNKKQNTSETTSNVVTKTTTTFFTESSYSSQTVRSGTISSSSSQSPPIKSYTPVYPRTQAWADKYRKTSLNIPTTVGEQSFHRTGSLITKSNTPLAPTQTNPLVGTSNGISGLLRPAPVSSFSGSNKSPQSTSPYQSTKEISSPQTKVQNSSKPIQRPIPNISKTSDAVPFKVTPPPPTFQAQQPPKDDLTKLLKIKVIKSTVFYDQKRKEPTYQTHGKKRGYCLIINNIMFDNNLDALRKGAKLDGENLKKLFTKMGFKVNYNENLKYRAMESLLNTHSKRSELKDMDISVVVIMSHGKGTKEGSTHIMCTDDREIATSDIVDKFDNMNCPNLCNKPKIFIFQCCRGKEDQIVEHDAVMTKLQTKKVNDMLLAFSTIPGYVSHRNPTFGTWYVQALCLVFMEHAHDTDVETMLKMVGEKLDTYSRDTFQTSSYENRGFKTCFLHPK